MTSTTIANSKKSLTPKSDKQKSHPKDLFTLLTFTQYIMSRHSLLAWAIKESSRLGNINNRNYFLIVLEAGKFKTKDLTDLVSGESPLPGLLTNVFLTYLHLTERKFFCLSFYKGTSFIELWPHP